MNQAFDKGSCREARTSKKRSGTNHCKNTRRNSGDPLADKAAEEGASVERRDDNPRGDLATKRHYCKNKLNKGAVYQPANVSRWRTVSLVLADP